MTRPLTVFDAETWSRMDDVVEAIGKLADEVTDVLPVVVDMVKDIGRFEPRSMVVLHAAVIREVLNGHYSDEGDWNNAVAEAEESLDALLSAAGSGAA